MLEIYNEQVRDLLTRDNPKGGLAVRQNPKLGLFYVEKLRKVAVGSYSEIERRMEEGEVFGDTTRLQKDICCACQYVDLRAGLFSNATAVVQYFVQVKKTRLKHFVSFLLVWFVNCVSFKFKITRFNFCKKLINFLLVRNFCFYPEILFPIFRISLFNSTSTFKF